MTTVCFDVSGTVATPRRPDIVTSLDNDTAHEGYPFVTTVDAIDAALE